MTGGGQWGGGPKAVGWEAACAEAAGNEGIWPAGGAWHQSCTEKNDEYVEWRRVLAWDLLYQKQSDEKTFLRLMTKIGLYTDRSEATIKGDTVELNLRRSFGGTLTFYISGKSAGKITIGQSNIDKKAKIWRILAPHTEECTERQAKRKRMSQHASSSGAAMLPTPAELALGFA